MFDDDERSFHSHTMYAKCSLDRWNIKLNFFRIHLWGNFLRSSEHEATLKSEQNIDSMEKVELNLKIVGSSRRVLWRERFTLQTTQLLHVPNVVSLSVVIRAALLITKHFWPINIWVYASVRRWEGGNLITIRLRPQTESKQRATIYRCCIDMAWKYYE